MSSPGEKLVLRAPAKINLYLEVLDRRQNGYHDVRSIVCPVGVYDEVTIQKAGGRIETRCERHDKIDGMSMPLPGPAENLATQAAEKLKGLTGCRAGALIHVVKRIPVGGGLGGGSADAAAVLIGLNRLWDTGLSVAELMQAGSALGCDVPALVHGGVVCVRGLGEKVSPVESAGSARLNGWVVIANPGFGVSTRDIYERYRSFLTPDGSGFRDMVSAVAEGDRTRVREGLYNALEPTVLDKYPVIALLKEAVLRAGAEGALLSGSGASVFGLARDESHARALSERVPGEAGFPVWAAAARMLPDGVTVAHGPLEA